MIPEQGQQQVSTHVQALNQRQQTQQVTDTPPAAAASARVNPFDDVMTSVQLRKRLSPQETAHAEFHSMAALLDSLRTSTWHNTRVRTAFVLRNQLQVYRKKHRRMQHNDVLAMLVTQLDRVLFDDTFPPDIRTDIVRISSISADIAAFIQQVAERREVIAQGADLARMMLQWVEDISPDTDSVATELKQAFPQLEFMWNSEFPHIDTPNVFHWRDGVTLRRKLNADLVKEQDIASQLARLAPYDNNWLLIASQHDNNQLRFLIQHMESFKKAGFTTLVLKQLTTREGPFVEHFLRTGEPGEALDDFLLKKISPGKVNYGRRCSKQHGA